MEPDFSDWKQLKYWNWFYIETGASAGFAFAGTGSAASSTDANIGSRLCFKSRELAEYAGKQFIDLYKELF
jgi:hypothetical protein